MISIYEAIVLDRGVVVGSGGQREVVDIDHWILELIC